MAIPVPDGRESHKRSGSFNNNDDERNLRNSPACLRRALQKLQNGFASDITAYINTGNGTLDVDIMGYFARLSGTGGGGMDYNKVTYANQAIEGDSTIHAWSYTSSTSSVHTQDATIQITLPNGRSVSNSRTTSGIDAQADVWMALADSDFDQPGQAQLTAPHVLS